MALKRPPRSLYTCRGMYERSGSSGRYFSSKSDSDDTQEIHIESAAAEAGGAESTASSEDSSQAGGLLSQYRLVPVAEHPLFPGSSQAMQLSKSQYEILKDSEELVFASIVKNDEILQARQMKLAQGADPSMMLNQNEPHQDFRMPEITDLTDVYETGVLCSAKAMHDPNNVFLPYILNLFPIEKANLFGAV